MNKPALTAATALLIFTALPLMGCMDTQNVVVHEQRPRGDVPFRGLFSKVAEGTFKNGRRVRVANANGAATVRIERNRVIYDQTYVSHGELRRVIQTYSFSSRDVRHSGGNNYEVNLTFRGISGDTSGYSPDRNDPKLEAHRTGSGWVIELFTTDNNGIIGVVELQ